MKQTILLVEDDVFLKKLLSKKFEKADFTTLVATDGKDAVKQLESATPNLVILDLMLPNMSGFEVLKTIRENNKLRTVPVIVFSNLSDEESMQKCTNLGIKEYLVKSNITPEELLTKIRKYLA
jgi:DNA-binding response OmpR family regulator